MPRKQREVKTIAASQMILLPPHPDLCQTCATDHHPELPHNQQSLYYQMRFQMDHGRWPTWEDAMAHCTDDTRSKWQEAMKRVEVRSSCGS
jgi:hypothetical protein